MTDLTPREIVSELDRFIIGQKDAKRAVAVALRNRWRRKQLDADLREEVYPKNILMIGPTGVGKTEISRRLAKLAGAPFLSERARSRGVDIFDDSDADASQSTFYVGRVTPVTHYTMGGVRVELSLAVEDSKTGLALYVNFLGTSRGIGLEAARYVLDMMP